MAIDQNTTQVPQSMVDQFNNINKQAQSWIASKNSSTNATNSATPITPTMPNNASTIDLSGLNSNNTDFDSIIKSVTSAYSTQNNATQQEQDSLISDIKSRMGDLTGKTADQQVAEDTAGVTQDKKDINDITAQLKQIADEQTAQELKIGKEGISAGAMKGRNISLERDNAIRSLTLKSTLDALQGNLTNAQANADRAVALKYDPIETEINNKLKLIDLNKDKLSAEQKKQADIMITALTTYKDNIATKKVDEQNKQKLALDLAGNGAPLAVVQQVQGSSDYNSAIDLATKSGYMATKSSGSGTTTGLGSNIDNDVEAVLTGKNTLYEIRQTMGRTNAAAAYMENMRSKIMKIDPNFDFVASNAGSKFVSSTFYQKAMSAITSVEPNIDKAIELSNQVDRYGISYVNSALQKTAMTFGNTKVSSFKQAQKLIADEIGLALGQGTVSDMKLQLGFDITDPSLSQEQFAQNMVIVKEFLANRKKALTDQRYQSSTVINNQSTDSMSDEEAYQQYLKVAGNSTPYSQPQNQNGLVGQLWNWITGK